MNCIVEGLFSLTDPTILPKNEMNNRGAFSDCQKGGEKPEKQDTGHGLQAIPPGAKAGTYVL